MISFVHVLCLQNVLNWLKSTKQYKIQLNTKKTESMKKNREIDLAVPLMADNYHGLEISLTRGSLEDKVKRETLCFSWAYER